VKNNKNLIAHHIVPIYVDAMKIVDVNNGITLCIKCHKKTLTREAEYSDYYSGLLGLPAPEVGKQLFKTINVFQVLRKLELGHTHKQTAKHFGMSAQTLRTKLFGVVLPPRSYRPKGCTFYTVLKLKVDGNSVRKIAKLLCTTTIKVVGILRLWGITIRHKKAKEKGLTGNIIRKTMHMTVKQLSEYFGVSKMTVSRCRIQYGVI